MAEDGIAKDGKPYKIVICDDKKLEVQQIKSVLESKQYNVIEVFSNGRELVEWYKNYPGAADLLIIDVIMPVLDGYAALWELKEFGPLPKIVFISVENTATLIKDVLARGVLDYLTKPLKRDMILERVGKAVRR
ncbi:MAG: response regulator [Spirochaetia bacterium]|nr:response regulator [Spirochaetia bacterium]